MRIPKRLAQCRRTTSSLKSPLLQRILMLLFVTLLICLQMHVTTSESSHHVQVHHGGADRSLNLSDHIIAAARQNSAEFVNRLSTIPYMEYGVLNSEALALVTMCKLLNITHFIESGTANGYSTELVALSLGAHTQIFTIDMDDKYELGSKTAARLKQYSNVECLTGNSTVEVPRILDMLDADSRVAVFVDGPKGLKGLQLMQDAFRFDKVVFTALHDMAPYWSTDIYGPVTKWDLFLFATCELWWRQQFQQLDHANGADKFMGDNRDFGSYGFGLAFAMREREPLADGTILPRSSSLR